jgi:hypothetical protein
MPRKIKTDDWVRTPEFEDAWRRTIDTAWQCAALFWGETPTQTPQRDASMLVTVTAMAMAFFMHRIDPKDAALLYVGPGSFADLYKPYPPDVKPMSDDVVLRPAAGTRRARAVRRGAPVA